MPVKLIIAPEVEQVISEAYAWYEEQKIGLGEEFLSCVDALVHSIVRMPKMYEVVFNAYRRGLTRRFPYGIFYEYKDETVAHELAHIITLAPDQVSWLELEDSDPATYYIYEYDLDTAPESYVNLFFGSFWADIYLEWSDFYYEYGIQYYGEEQLYEENEQTLYVYLDDFYDKYAERFVTEYAAISPVEDVAETFMLFVLEDKPTGNKVSDKKMRFIYEFPELIEVRDHAQEYLESIGYSYN